MELFKNDKSNLKGKNFEERVFIAIQRLEDLGFARELKFQDKVLDKNGNSRKIDISFILCTDMIELRISVECKSRERNLTLDDINQIKIFKSELPERNLFWIVTDSNAGENVLKSLKNDGISFYEINELELIISNLCKDFKNSNIITLRRTKEGFNSQCIYRTPYSDKIDIELHKIENKLLKSFQNELSIINLHENEYLVFEGHHTDWNHRRRLLGY